MSTIDYRYMHVNWPPHGDHGVVRVHNARFLYHVGSAWILGRIMYKGIVSGALVETKIILFLGKNSFGGISLWLLL